jgi:hypothetical protein
MRIETVGTARIRHKETGEIHEIDSDEVDDLWEQVGGSERQMGPENEYAAELQHPDLGDLVWRLWEYPVGAENFQQQDLNGHELVQDFDISLVHEPDDYEAPEEEEDDSPSAAVNEIREWFAQNYEDPGQSLPYNSSEGGYQWIRGGPYSALEAIEGYFGTSYPFGLLAEVARDIVSEAGGLDEWSPIDDPDHDDFDDDEPGPDIEENRLRAARRVQKVALELKSLLAPLTEIERETEPLGDESFPGAGHNGPPGPIEDVGFPKTFFTELDLLSGQISEQVERLDDLVENEFATAAKPSDPSEGYLSAIRENTAALEAQSALIRESSRLVSEHSSQLKSALKKVTVGGVAGVVILKIAEGALNKIGEMLVESGAPLAGSLGSTAMTYLEIVAAKAFELAQAAVQFLGTLPSIF